MTTQETNSPRIILLDKVSIRTHFLTIGILVAVLTISSITATSFVSADQFASKTATIVVPAVCSVNATGMDTHTTSVTPGSYTENIGTTTATVTCNDNEGFSIYASGFTGDEVNKTNSNKLVGTGTSSNATISTGTATSGGTSNWSMKLSTPTSPTPQYPLTILGQYGNYTNVPNNYTKVITRTAATDTGEGAIGSTFTTTYATFISHTQTADTYTGKVRYILVHPNTATVPTEQTTEAGYIGYYPNANGVLGEMGKQQATRARDWSQCTGDTDMIEYCYDADWNEIDIDTLPILDHYENILYAPNFKRDGYGFAGWNTKPDYSGKMYGPSETITLTDVEASKGLSLYAVWVQSEGSFQHSATKVCNSLTKAPTDGTATLDSVSALTDIRDGNTYAVAKLADNKCWMIENLRLDNTAELTAANTNAPALPLTNTDGTTSNHLSPSTDPTQTEWCDDINVACLDKSMLATDNTTSFTSNTSTNYDIASNVYSYGNYYSWYSATAGNGTYSISTNNQSVTGSICPNGWKLPAGGDINNKANSDFWKLSVDTIGAEPVIAATDTYPYYEGTEGITASKAMRAYPNNFIYSGYVDGSSLRGRGLSGDYWASTAIRSYRAYEFDLTSGYMSPSHGNPKYGGHSARCLANI